jgi:SAM-dependent methyltransferase
MTAANVIQRLDARWYPSHAGGWDDAMFRSEILSRVGPTSRVLDLGAGAGIVPHMNFRGIVGRVCGVDLDPRVLNNPFLDEAAIGAAEQLPHPDESFDVVFADNVLEHLPDPLRAFEEVRRVLRPGGIFLAKTPNKRHYMPLIARLTPHSFHRFYNKRRGRAGEDTFPTKYLANSPRDVERLARAAGLQVRSLRLVEGRPEYLRISAITYAVGYLYERLVNRFDALSSFRILLIAELSRPAR